MATKWWFSGPPPSIGWWPASVFKNDGVYRWWNGVVWSTAVTSKYSAKKAAELAYKASANQGAIRWTHRPENWPARSKT